MADREQGSLDHRGHASPDGETGERAARWGREASHGGQGGSSGGTTKGSPGGAGYDPGDGRCRDEQGQFTGCDDTVGGSGSSGRSRGGD